MLEQKISDEEKKKRFLEELNKRMGVDYKNLSQLADMLKHAYPNLTQMISGAKPLADILIYKWCELFQYKPGYFFGRDPFLVSYGKNDVSPDKAKETLMKILGKQQEISNILREALKSD